jgi:predicted phage terminase large subunit-like protein
MIALDPDPIKASADLERLNARMAEMRLRQFARVAWPIVEPSTKYISGWHIDAVAEHLEAVSAGAITRLLITMPPRHMKSLLVNVFWAPWEWTRRAAVRWIFASYSGSLSKRDSLKCRRVVSSEWYQRWWGDRVKIAPDQNEKSRFELTSTGYRIATSSGATTIGEGGDRIVVDDPHNITGKESAAERQSTCTWWWEGMGSRGNESADLPSAWVVVGQRVHHADLQQECIDRGYEVLNLPARFERTPMIACTRFQDQRVEEGAPLWPERFPEKKLAALETTLGPHAAAAQLQQRPTPRGGNIIKADWFVYFSTHEMPPAFDRMIASCDLSGGSKAETASHVSMQLWGALGALRYLLSAVHERMDLPEIIAKIRALQDDPLWSQAQGWLVEDKALGPAILQTLKDEIQGLISYNPTGKGNKLQRLIAVSTIYEARQVYLPERALWRAGYIAQLTTFPASAGNDHVDASSQALDYLRQKSAWGDVYFGVA